MNTGDLLTVKEFAKAAGVSRQTVYNRLDKDLTAYLTEVDSVKYIDKAALQLFKSNLDSQIDSPIDSGFDKNLTGFDSHLTTVLQQSIDLQAATITALQAQLDTLQKQLEAKDEQISLLQAHTDRQQQTIDNLTQALTQQQALNAAAAVIQKQLIDQTEGATAPDPSRSSDTQGDSSTASEKENAADQTEGTPKRGLFARIRAALHKE